MTTFQGSGKMWLAATMIITAVAAAGAGIITAFAQTASRSESQRFPVAPNQAVVEREITRVQSEIDRTFQETLEKAGKLPDDPSLRLERIQTLGKLLLYDKRLSVRRNTACVFCHMPETGFTGPISELNRTTVSYPGSIRNASADPAVSRYSGRKPMSYGYSTYSPVLHYNEIQEDFYGGNFWDMRASGWKLQNPASEQAGDPLLDPLEQGLIDSACVVYLVSQGPYKSFLEQLWGVQAFDVKWPADIEEVCSKPGPPPSDNPHPVRLSPEDRGRVESTYDQINMSMAAYEGAPDISPFSSKFDYALAHPDTEVLTQTELAGWQLFRTKGKCNTCHLDGTAMVRGEITPAKATDKAPLFTDFTSANLGIPKNLSVPYLYESNPDQYGYVANLKGLNYVDKGVADFLSGEKGENPSREWAAKADNFEGKFQVATLRNVDLRPGPDFVKAYGHNGYFKSLKEIVHFYNTRDNLPRCPQGSTGEKQTCWPPPEVPANLNQVIGNLGLSDAEEDRIVAFLKTISDGHVPPNAK